jgi:uncharacterized protein (TIGR02271 family)
MKWSENLNKVQILIAALSIAGLGAGCCTKKKSAAKAQPYPPVSYGAAETKSEYQTGGESAQIPLYEESMAVGKQRVDQGSVHIRKVVKTETVNQPIELRRETIVIDREPAGSQSQSSASADAFKEGETVIQLWKEEPVVETRVVSAGTIVARKQSEVQQTNVQRELRREDIDVAKSENVTISPNVTNPPKSGEPMGAAGEVGGQSKGAASSGMITDAQTLTTSQNPASLSQRSVQINGLKVDKVIGDRLVQVSDSAGRPLFVRLNESMPNVKSGSTLNITGKVETIPTSMPDLGLGSEAKSALKGQEIFIDADHFEVNR